MQAAWLQTAHNYLVAEATLTPITKQNFNRNAVESTYNNIDYNILDIQSNLDVTNTGMTKFAI